MFCTVYRLRSLGARIRPTNPLYLRGVEGFLVYDKDQHGQMCAQLFEVENNHELMRLQRAHVVKARDGGLLIAGDEMHFRASKDKGTTHRQTWWCVPLTKVQLSTPDPSAPAEPATSS